ncbi:hypothetical protein ABK040_012590 [Willaertia magna]
MVRKGATPTNKPKVKGVKPQKHVTLHFHVDCKVPVQDGILDLDHFEQYVKDRLKVQGRTNNLKDKVSFGKHNDKLYLHADVKLRKKYLKYLTKKYLKKQNLRDWLRVVSKQRGEGYALRYYNIADEENQATEEEQTTEETQQ